MRSIRKGNDVRNLEILVSRLSVPVTNWDELLDLKVSCFERSRKNYLIAPDVVYKEDGKLRLYFEGNKLSEGVYDLLITFSIPDPIMPDAIEDKAIDIQNIFRIVPTTAQEVDSQDPFSVDLNFAKDGLDYYHIWSQYHEGSIEDMFVWHRQPAVEAAAALDLLASDFAQASESWTQEEQSRQSQEATRQQNETTRGTAETDRTSAETGRVNAESARATAETERQDNEANRINAETERETAEIDREAAEAGRVNAESARATAETERQDNEANRINAETERETAEIDREAAEAGRVNAESARATAETERQDNEANRINAETERETAETGREAAESIRQSNEQTRIDNDNAREGVINDIKLKTELNSHDISSLQNTLTSINANQESTITAEGYKQVSLHKNAANGGMGVKLEGLTAENLVVNGDFRDGTTGWFESGASLSTTEQNVTVFETINPSGRIYKTGSLTGGVYYFSAKMKVTSDTLSGISIGYFTTVSQIVASQNNPIKDSWYTLSGIATISEEVTRLVQIMASASGTTVEIDKRYGVKIINLTSLFGPGNEITDIPTLEAILPYIEGVKSAEVTGRVKSIGKNIFKGINAAIIYDTYIAYTGTEFMSLSWCILDYMSVIPEMQYTLNWGVGASSASVVYYDENKQYIGGNSLASIRISDDKSLFTTPSYCKYIRVSIYRHIIDSYINSIQIEKGSVVTNQEPYAESNFYLQSSFLRSNGTIRDEIRKSLNGYEHVKRVELKDLLVGDEIIPQPLNFNIGWRDSTNDAVINISSNQFTTSFSGGVLFESLQLSNSMLLIEIKGSTSAGSIRIRNGNDMNGSFSFSGAFYATYITNFGNQLSLYISTSGAITVTIDKLSVKRILNTDDGIVPSKVLQYDNQILYTLTTPVITPISAAGLLTSHPNGTLYHEPVIADAGIYSTNITIQDTAHPIVSLEKLIKREAGVEYLLDITLAQIAPDGLSFTHPELSDGDLVLFTYFFATEGPNGKLTASFYNSNQVRIDPVTGKAYKKDWAVNNGVITETLIEV